MLQIFVGYVVILLASLFGNTVIIHIIRTDNSMKTTTNYLILNQACADILITLVEVAYYLSYSTSSKWPGGLLGVIICKVFKASLFILPVFSVWILVTIVVDRFYAVTRPFRVSPLSQHFKKTILVLWCWSIACSANAFKLTSLEKGEEYHYCITNILLDEWKTFSVVATVLNVISPLLIIAALYTVVCLKLWSREVPGEGANQNERQAEAMKTAKKVTRMVIAVVVLYVLCWGPLLISVTLNVFGHAKIDFIKSSYFFINWLSVAYSGLNPYVYLTFNPKFRDGLSHLFGNCLRRVKCSFSSRSESVDLEQT